MVPQAAAKKDEALTLRLLEAALGDLPFRRKVVFGVPSYFAGGAVFAVLWEGRLGLLFRDPADAERLMGHPGSAPWFPGHDHPPAPNAVLVAKELADDADAFAPWVQRAHAQASTAKGRR